MKRLCQALLAMLSNNVGKELFEEPFHNIWYDTFPSIHFIDEEFLSKMPGECQAVIDAFEAVRNALVLLDEDAALFEEDSEEELVK